MKLKPGAPSKTPDLSGLSTAELLSVVEDLQQELAAKSAEIQQRDQAVKQRDHTIQILEELLRWKRIQQFGASSEKSAHQIQLFDEAELEVEIDALRDQLPDDVESTRDRHSTHHLISRGYIVSCPLVRSFCRFWSGCTLVLADGPSGPRALRRPIRISDGAFNDRQAEHFPPPLSNTFQSGRLAGVLACLAHSAIGQYCSFFTNTLGHKPAIRIRKSKRPRGRSLRAF